MNWNCDQFHMNHDSNNSHTNTIISNIQHYSTYCTFGRSFIRWFVICYHGNDLRTIWGKQNAICQTIMNTFLRSTEPRKINERTTILHLSAQILIIIMETNQVIPIEGIEREIKYRHTKQRLNMWWCTFINGLIVTALKVMCCSSASSLPVGIQTIYLSHKFMFKNFQFSNGR